MKTIAQNPCKLGDLPSPPPGRKGWPWTENPPVFPELAPNGKPWPKISIVTPSYNQGEYLEEAIRSVLLQGYPNLEFFIYDAVSKDNSVEIIRKYEPWLTGWVSRKDEGQSDAVNQGFAQSTGEIFNWICSDDRLTPGALLTVAQAFSEGPECDVVAGNCYCEYQDDPSRDEVKYSFKDRLDRMPYAFFVWQPSCFYRRSLVRRPELLRKDLHYCMDRELWCYFWSQKARWKWLDATLSINRFTGLNKSIAGRDKVIRDVEDIYGVYIKERVPLTFWLAKVWLPLIRTSARSKSAVVGGPCRLLSRMVSLCLHGVYSRDRVRVLQDEYHMYCVSYLL